MKTKKGIFIQTEKYERIRIRRKTKQKVLKSFCEDCRKEIEWLDVEEVLISTKITKEEIKALVSKNILHVDLSKDGKMLICADSITNIVSRSNYKKENCHHE